MWINIVAQLEEARDRRLKEKENYFEQLEQGEEIEEAKNYFREHNCCPYREEELYRGILPVSTCALGGDRCLERVSECDKYKKREKKGFEDLEKT